MRHRKPSRKLRKTMLAKLIREIDTAVDDYARSNEWSFYPLTEEGQHLEVLLNELHKYHPLSIRTRKHGYRLYRKLLPKENRLFSELLFDMRTAFDLPYGRSPFRWYRRWWYRNVVNVFQRIVEKLEAIYAMFLE